MNNSGSFLEHFVQLSSQNNELRAIQKASLCSHSFTDPTWCLLPGEGLKSKYFTVHVENRQRFQCEGEVWGLCAALGTLLEHIESEPSPGCPGCGCSAPGRGAQPRVRVLSPVPLLTPQDCAAGDGT